MPVRYQISGRGAAAISASVEAGVRLGTLASGDALPPVRALAADLAVAPATVAAAYRELRQRGVVETAGRNGTRVRQRPPVAARMDRRMAVPRATVDLASGEPDPELLPPLGAMLSRLSRTAARPISYAGSGAMPELVSTGQDRLSADGVPAIESGVTVTSGALDAIERILTAHLRPGDRVGVEDPAWANVIDLVATLSMQAIPVPVDDQGPTVDGLQRAINAGIAAVVITSRAQNPTGGSVTPDRAADLRRLLVGAELLVIEDDHAAELATEPLAPLAGAGQSWAFVRSLSKPYGPDLRVAILAGDEATIARVQGRMRLGAGWVSTVLQRLAVEMWSDDEVAERVATAKREYEGRREALLAALAERSVPARGRSGINVWIPVDHESVVVAALLERGFAVSPGSLFRQQSRPGVRISIGHLRLSHVDTLADAVADAVAPSGAIFR